MRSLFRKLVLTLFISAFAFLANAQSTKSPLAFSNDLVTITDTLYKKGQDWGRALNEAYKTGNYAALKPVREGLQTFIEAKLKYVTALKDVNNSKPLRQAFIDFLNYEKKLAIEAFAPFETLPTSVSNEVIQEHLAKLRDLASQESAMMTQMREAQKRYASENDFRIEE